MMDLLLKVSWTFQFLLRIYSYVISLTFLGNVCIACGIFFAVIICFLFIFIKLIFGLLFHYVYFLFSCFSFIAGDPFHPIQIYLLGFFYKLFYQETIFLVLQCGQNIANNSIWCFYIYIPNMFWKCRIFKTFCKKYNRGILGLL